MRIPLSGVSVIRTPRIFHSNNWTADAQPRRLFLASSLFTASPFIKPHLPCLDLAEFSALGERKRRRPRHTSMNA